MGAGAGAAPPTPGVQSATNGFSPALSAVLLVSCRDPVILGRALLLVDRRWRIRDDLLRSLLARTLRTHRHLTFINRHRRARVAFF